MHPWVPKRRQVIVQQAKIMSDTKQNTMGPANALTQQTMVRWPSPYPHLSP